MMVMMMMMMMMMVFANGSLFIQGGQCHGAGSDFIFL